MAASNNNVFNKESVEQNLGLVKETINFERDEDDNLILNIPVVHNSKSSQLDELLKYFDLSEVKPYLTRAEIAFESLKYLSKEDIKEAIPPIGLRACFREKLFIWRKSEYGIDDDTLSGSIP